MYVIVPKLLTSYHRNATETNRLLGEQDTTDFMTICDGLDVTRETCHSNTAWCVMDHATFTKGRVDKSTALAKVQTCVAGRILNRDGDVSTRVLYKKQNQVPGPYSVVFCIDWTNVMRNYRL